MFAILNTRRSYILALCLASILYLIFAIFTFIAYYGGSPAFPFTLNEIKEITMMEITPIPSIFIIWCLNTVYQIMWLTYSLTSLFREGSEAKIQSTHTVLAFFLYTNCGLAWIFFYSRADFYWTLVMIGLGQFFLSIAYGYACADLTHYLNIHDVRIENVKDLWCHRILIQNGLMFSLAWNTLGLLLTIASFIHIEFGVEDSAISSATLFLLGVIIILWFFIENTFLREYTQFTLMNYIVLIGSLICVHKRTRQSKNKDSTANIVIGLMAITSCLFFIRLVILFFKSYEKRKPKNEKVQLRRIKHDETGKTRVKVYRSFSAF